MLQPVDDHDYILIQVLLFQPRIQGNQDTEDEVADVACGLSFCQLL